MQPTFIDFSKLNGQLEPYGDNLVLKLSTIEGVSDASYLSRAVNTLLNFGAIDFIPEPGVREYENLRPYVAGVDTYAMLQTSRGRLTRALETLGITEALAEFGPLLEKRNTRKPRNKVNPRETDLFPEIDKLHKRHESGFAIVKTAAEDEEAVEVNTDFIYRILDR